MGTGSAMRAVAIAMLAVVALQTLVAEDIVTDMTDMDVDLELLQAPGDAERATALAQAKDSCKASWTTTKVQCEKTKEKVAAGFEAVKKHVLEASQAIKKVVETSLNVKRPAVKRPASPGNATKTNSTKAKNAASVEELGESVTGADAKAHALAHASCQGMWAGVETLCTQADSAAIKGASDLKTALLKAADGFVKTIEAVVKKHTHATSPAKGSNSTAKSNSTKKQL